MSSPSCGFGTHDSTLRSLNGSIDHDAPISHNLPPYGPLLNVFPRGNPDAAFLPLRTRYVFKTSVTRTAPVDSDSESSTLYKSTDDEDRELPSTPSKSPSMSPVAGSGLKSVLKKAGASPRISTSASSTNPSTPSAFVSSPSSPSPSFFEDSLVSRRTVRIIEPVEELAELHELRKSFNYGYRGGSRRRKQISIPLPSSPKLGRQSGVTIELVQKTFQRTPPTKSSSARAKVESFSRAEFSQ